MTARNVCTYPNTTAVRETYKYKIQTRLYIAEGNYKNKSERTPNNAQIRKENKTAALYNCGAINYKPGYNYPQIRDIKTERNLISRSF
jgi:hypothetical protein